MRRKRKSILRPVIALFFLGLLCFPFTYSMYKVHAQEYHLKRASKMTRTAARGVRFSDLPPAGKIKLTVQQEETPGNTTLLMETELVKQPWLVPYTIAESDADAQICGDKIYLAWVGSEGSGEHLQRWIQVQAFEQTALNLFAEAQIAKSEAELRTPRLACLESRSKLMILWSDAGLSPDQTQLFYRLLPLNFFDQGELLNTLERPFFPHPISMPVRNPFFYMLGNQVYLLGVSNAPYGFSTNEGIRSYTITSLSDRGRPEQVRLLTIAPEAVTSAEMGPPNLIYFAKEKDYWVVPFNRLKIIHDFRKKFNF